MEDRAPPHRLLPGGGGSPRHVGEPRRESSRAGATLCPGPSSCLYSPKCVEEEFCELRLEGFLGSSPHTWGGGIMLTAAKGHKKGGLMTDPQNNKQTVLAFL